MKTSIRLKLIAYTFLLILIVGGAISLFSIHEGQQLILSTYEKKCTQITDLIAQTLMNDIYFLDSNAIRLHLEDTRINPDIINIYVMDMEGNILSDGTLKNSLSDQKLQGAFNKKVLKAKEWISKTEGDLLKIGGPVLLPDSNVVGYLQIDFTLGRLYQIVNHTTRFNILITLVCMAIGAVLAFITSSIITKPLPIFLKATQEIKKGNFKARVLLNRGDELGMLANSLNQMAEALETNTTSISRLNDEIKDRKEIEEALRYSEQRYKTLIETAPDLISIVDREGAIISLNPAFEKITGWTIQEWIGKNFAPLIHSDDLPRIRENFKRVLKGTTPPVFEMRIQSKSGQYLVVESASKPQLIKGEVVGVLGISRDISRRKKAEEELQKLYSELEIRVKDRTKELAKSNHLLKQKTEELKRSNTELEQFAYIASHDLQEPLYVIQAFIDTLQTQYKKKIDPEMQILLERIRNAAARMSQLIYDVLEFSRITMCSKPFVRVDLNQTLQEVLGDLEIRIRECQAKIEYDSLPTVCADELQMRQLFQNLLSNALKFRRKDIAPHIQVRSEMNSDTSVKILVQDNGIGFEKEYVEKIFAPFQRLHSRNQYEGSGIGLAICKKIVEQHQGRIGALSQEGEWTQFIITLPLKSEAVSEILSEV
ncbi:MAG: PAS domain S-box protein [Deltaproteobacteria bacterium]|nr:PAS domain S-box protein [Deltaproteobacteria bacterium]